MSEFGRVLVTGGAGFIGSHTCKLLASRGYEPVTFDNLSTGNKRAAKWGPLIIGDLCDTALLQDEIVNHDISAVIHFAACAYVGESVRDPAKYYLNNVTGMRSLLDACVATGIDRFIFSSSCATYGIPETLPIAETAAQNPISPYGRTKLWGEQMLADYSRAYGLKYTNLRYFNACGADPEGEIGEWHDPETHLIPLALSAASGKIPHLEIFGTDYDTPDGTCMRDYIHVCDLARAHLLALERLANGGGNLSANLGTGKSHSIREIVDAIKRITGKEVPVRFADRREGDPPSLFADPTLAAEELGFKAELSDMDTIIRTAAPFFGLELMDEIGC